MHPRDLAPLRPRTRAPSQFWVHDFPLRSALSPPSSLFGDGLCDFVCQMLRPSPALTEAWAARLGRYDLAPPAGFHLVASVPGRYEATDARYGAQALRRALGEALRGRDDATRHASVEFGFSSVGKIEKLVWSPLCEAFRQGASPAHGESGDAVPVRLVWPSMANMFGVMGKRGSWFTGLEYGPVGPGAQWTASSFPKAAFCHHVMPWARRARTYHHCKVAAGWTAAHELVWLYAGSHNLSGAAWGKVDAMPEHGRREGGGGGAGRGSGGSGGAGRGSAGGGGAGGGSAGGGSAGGGSAGGGSSGATKWSRILMAYELGVLYVPPAPLPTDEARTLVPWQTPARPYGPTTLPYSLSFCHQQVEGKGALFEAAAWSDVAAARSVALRLASTASCLASSGMAPPLPLPPLLTCPFGQLRHLLKLRVGSAPVRILKQLPAPPSSRPNHLSVRLDHVATGSYGEDGCFTPFPMAPPGSTLLASVATVGVDSHGERKLATFTVGKRATPDAAADPTMTFYSLARDDALHGGGATYVADRSLEFGALAAAGELPTQPTLSIAVPTAAADTAEGGPCGGFLLLLLSEGEKALSARLLQDVSAARAVIEEGCWGCLVLRPSAGFDAAWLTVSGVGGAPGSCSCGKGGGDDCNGLRFECARIAFTLSAP